MNAVAGPSPTAVGAVRRRRPVLAVKNIEVIYNSGDPGAARRLARSAARQDRCAAWRQRAGKSTTLKSISDAAALGTRRGRPRAAIEFRGQRTDQLTPGDLVEPWAWYR